MNRVCCLVLFLAALSALAAEEPKTPRTDLYGDPLPPGAVARMGTMRLRHANAIFTFSPDGKQLISCAPSGDIRFWDVGAGKLLRRQRLWRTKESREYLPFRPWPSIAALTMDGATVAKRDGDTVSIYDTSTGKVLDSLALGPVADNVSRNLSFSWDSKVLVVTDSDDKDRLTVQWWHIGTGKLRRSFKGSFSNPIACSPDGKHLATLHKHREIHLWDAIGGKKMGSVQASTISPPVFSPDGKTLAADSFDEGKLQLRLWDVATLKEKVVLDVLRDSGKATYISRLVFCPDGRFMAGVCSNCRSDKSKEGVVVWDLSGRKKPQWLPERGIKWLALAAGGQTLACCGWDREIRLWDLAAGRQLHHRPGHVEAVRSLAVSPDGRVLASGAETLRLWNTATSKPLRVFEDGSWKVLISPDGKRVISTNKDSVRVWDAANGKELRRFSITRPLYATIDMSQIEAIGLSADGNRLTAVMSDYPIKATQLYHWEIDSGQLLSKRSYPMDKDSRIHPLAVSPDGERVYLRREKKVSIEDARTGRRLRTLPECIDSPLVFSPDGRLVATGNLEPREKISEGFDWKGLLLIETASGQEVLRLKTDEMDLLAFTSDARGLVAVDKKALYVWDVATEKLLYRMAWPASVLEEQYEHELAVKSLALLPDGRATTGMNDGTILVWDLAAKTWPSNGRVRELAPRELDPLWADLAGDAAAAHRVLHTLTASPKLTLPYLSDRLQRATMAESKRIERLLDDLDGDSFETREKASQELKRLYYRAEPILRLTLENKPSPEARRRIEAILAEPRLPLAKDLQMSRGIAVLERIGTPEARRILEKLAAGAMSPETREAQAALQRLKRRDASANGRSSP